MSSQIRLPLSPLGPSLTDCIANFETLEARLDALPSRSRWSTQVPINSKATFLGDIVHTNVVKINIGGSWWVQMMADEAAEHIRRRKAFLLEDHVRALEGRDRALSNKLPEPSNKASNALDFIFDPLFANPMFVNTPSKSTPTAPSQPNGRGNTNLNDYLQSEENKRENSASMDNLIDIVRDQLIDMPPMPLNTNDSVDSTVLNDEGLPIQEIRESLDGKTLGRMPQLTGDGAVTIDIDKEDYWGPEATARRNLLRLRIFSEKDFDSSSGEYDTENDVSPLSKVAVASGPVSTPVVRSDSHSAEPLTHSPGERLKSILKPTHQKKFVSFDQSLPLPPDSPPQLSKTADLEPDFVSKPVPILPAPNQNSKGNQPEKGYAGLRRGFLSEPKLRPVSETTTIISGVDSSTSRADAKPVPKKQSVFSQRRIQSTISPAPSLPPLSSAKPMAVMRNVVSENRPVTVNSPAYHEIMESNDGVHDAGVEAIDDDEDTSGDLGEFSEDEEDEYNLDEALLAREVALEYHRRQHWQRPVDDSSDPETLPGGDRAVFIGVPRISAVAGEVESNGSMLRIVNPSPDDLSHFIRVEQAEDGELVFETPVIGSSDSESDGEIDIDENDDSRDRRLRRQHRRDIKRHLRSGTYLDLLPHNVDSPVVLENASLPPEVHPAVEPPTIVESYSVGESRDMVHITSPSARPIGEPQAIPVEKKLSRFKASRLGQA